MTQQWKPIDSAPKDGTEIIVFHPEAGVCAAFCPGDGFAWHCMDGMNTVVGSKSGKSIPAMTSFLKPPTHWMPLPAAPGSTSSAPGDAQDERQAFEAWAKRTNQGYDLTPNVSGRMATYESNTTEHAYRGFFHGMAAPASGDAQTSAARDVLDERQRQIIGEGFSTARDDGYTNLELADAAAQYALQAGGWPSLNVWPWKPDTFKEGAPREMLVKAGALILAEIERLDRAASQQQEG